MTAGFDLEVILAAAYVMFLLVVAGCLELAARHTHRRSERMKVAGFRYDRILDVWTCPNDQRLVRAEADYANRLVIYRAPAHTCNSCSLKSNCTDSDEGRAIAHAPESWLTSELRRFHRGLSLALFALAAVILTAELLRFHDRLERVLLAAMMAGIVAGGLRLSSVFVRGASKGVRAVTAREAHTGTDRDLDTQQTG